MIWQKDIPYANKGDEKQAFDLYLPDAGQTVRGAVIWFHGGGIEAGTRQDNAFLAGPLAEKGFILCLPSYRLMPEARYPDFLYDAADAVKAARAEIRARTDGPILVGGSSAGAYLGMMLCFNRRLLSRVNLTPEDFDAYFFNAGQPTKHYNILKYSGEDPRRIVVDETAPLYHVTDARPGKPIMLLCSDNDIPSRRTQNLLLSETLLRFGYDPALITVETLSCYGHCGYDAALDANGAYILENRIISLLGQTGKLS